MHYCIEIKQLCSEEQHFLTKGPKGFALTVRERNANDYPTLDKAIADVNTLMGFSHKDIRKLLNKDINFITPVTFTVVSWKNSDTAPFKSRQKLYTFVNQD